MLRGGGGAGTSSRYAYTLLDDHRQYKVQLTNNVVSYSSKRLLLNKAVQPRPDTLWQQQQPPTIKTSINKRHEYCYFCAYCVCHFFTDNWLYTHTTKHLGNFQVCVHERDGPLCHPSKSVVQKTLCLLSPQKKDYMIIHGSEQVGNDIAYFPQIQSPWLSNAHFSPTLHIIL